MDCDECPFSPTYRNASDESIGTAVTWVVELVIGDENQALGKAFGTWMTSNHFLGGDQFFVAIDNAPGWPSS